MLFRFNLGGIAAAFLARAPDHAEHDQYRKCGDHCQLDGGKNVDVGTEGQDEQGHEPTLAKYARQVTRPPRVGHLASARPASLTNSCR